MNNKDKCIQCPLFEWCPSTSAVCRVRLPDEGCYWYRWFRQLIKENDKEDINEQLNTNN